MTVKTQQIEKAFEPVRSLQKLALDNAARLVEMQFAATRRYADLALSNAREVVELKDAAAVQAFVAKQPEAMKTLADDVRADAEEVVKMGVSYVEQAGQLFADSVQKAA